MAGAKLDKPYTDKWTKSRQAGFSMNQGLSASVPLTNSNQKG
jgi:hypothetical protein